LNSFETLIGTDNGVILPLRGCFLQSEKPGEDGVAQLDRLQARYKRTSCAKCQTCIRYKNNSFSRPQLLG
jgi:hypothetical protein